MENQIIIKKIKEIIETFGSFTTADLEAEVSPCIDSIGDGSYKLLEEFNVDDVRADSYEQDENTSQAYIGYDTIETDTLKDILNLAELWAEKNK